MNSPQCIGMRDGRSNFTTSRDFLHEHALDLDHVATCLAPRVSLVTVTFTVAHSLGSRKLMLNPLQAGYSKCRSLRHKQSKWCHQLRITRRILLNQSGAAVPEPPDVLSEHGTLVALAKGCGVNPTLSDVPPVHHCQETPQCKAVYGCEARGSEVGLPTGIRIEMLEH